MVEILELGISGGILVVRSCSMAGFVGGLYSESRACDSEGCCSLVWLAGVVYYHWRLGEWWSLLLSLLVVMRGRQYSL